MTLRREILAIAVPAIISNITTPLLGLADVTITGHIGDPVYIGAIAVGGTMFNILYWLFNFLRMGTSGPTAQAYGAGDNMACHVIFWRGLYVAFIMSAMLLALSGPLSKLILGFMDADDATEALARKYFQICIWGCPAVLVTYALSGWSLGMQNSRIPMWMSIVTNVVNIPISVYLVFGRGMKIEGVAIGTMTAQWIGFLVGLIAVLGHYRPKTVALRIIFKPKEILSFFRINTDIFLRTACLVCVTLWFTHAGALQGVRILAANALLLQLFMLFSFFMDGFAYAAEALAGKYHGMNDLPELLSLVKALRRVGLSFAIVFCAAYLLGGDFLLRMIAEDKDVVSLAANFLPWAAAVPICGYLAFIYDGVFVGLVRTRAMLMAMFTALIVFFIFYFSLIHKYGNDALWLAFCSYLFARGIVENFIFRIKIVKEL